MAVGWKKKQFEVVDASGVERPIAVYYDQPLSFALWTASSYGQRSEFQQLYFHIPDGLKVFIQDEQTFQQMLEQHDEVTAKQGRFRIHAPWYKVPSRTTERADVFMISKAFRDPTCCWCLVKPPDIQTLPCGHICLCTKCGAKVVSRKLRCPVCRADILSVALV